MKKDVKYLSNITNPGILLASYIDGGKEILSILGNRNMGLGISSAADKLEVNGNIRAKQIKEETTGWPDDVFEKGSALMPLSNLENYLHKNKHLPGMPSATEIETNGQNLREINAKLLQKTEELTLYLIRKHKQFLRQQQLLRLQQQLLLQQSELKKLKIQAAKIR